MSDAQTQPVLTALNGFVDEMLHTWRVPGCALAVVKDGAVIHAQGYGQRDAEHGLPATADTLFAIGSCTKAFTAFCLGLLVDEGKLTWDTPVRDLAPDFRLFDPVATERITVRDLLTHRSGLPRHDTLWYAGVYSRAELFARLRHLEPSHDLRTLWQYQNLMYMAAGVVVERVAGCTWEDFVRQRLFAPLGMTQSNLSINDLPHSDDYTLGYHEHEDQVNVIPFRNLDAAGPAGCINSSVREMTAWMLLHLNGGKHNEQALISPSTLQEMHTPQMVLPPGDPDDTDSGYASYGLGWVINTYRGHLFSNHGGGIDGFAALVTLLPRAGIGVVALSNRDGNPVPAILTNRVLDELLGLPPKDLSAKLKAQEDKAKQAAQEAKAKAKAAASASQPQPHTHALADYAGMYHHAGYGDLTITLRADGDSDPLRLMFGAFDLPLRHVRYDTFEFTLPQTDMSLRVTFQLDADGAIHAASIPFEAGVQPIIFTRSADAQLSAAETLARYAGDYDLAGTPVTFVVKGQRTLVATLPGQPPYELIPTRPHCFNVKGLEGFSLEFKLDDAHAENATRVVFHQPNGDFTATRK
jgi:CubicO group peptidase (beta-lactamase class C family)